MPAIENVTRRGAVYWWRRQLRFVGKLNAPVTIATTVSLLTMHQAVARRRASWMTARRKETWVGLYGTIEQAGLSADQTSVLMQQQMTRHRTVHGFDLFGRWHQWQPDGTGRRTAAFQGYCRLLIVC